MARFAWCLLTCLMPSWLASTNLGKCHCEFWGAETEAPRNGPRKARKVDLACAGKLLKSMSVRTRRTQSTGDFLDFLRRFRYHSMQCSQKCAALGLKMIQVKLAEPQSTLRRPNFKHYSSLGGFQ